MTAPRRRWFRFAFSLRALFVSVLCCACGAAIVDCARTRKRADSVEARMKEGEATYLGLQKMLLDSLDEREYEIKQLRDFIQNKGLDGEYSIRPLPAAQADDP